MIGSGRLGSHGARWLQGTGVHLTASSEHAAFWPGTSSALSGVVRWGFVVAGCQLAAGGECQGCGRVLLRRETCGECRGAIRLSGLDGGAWRGGSRADGRKGGGDVLVQFLFNCQIDKCSMHLGHVSVGNAFALVINGTWRRDLLGCRWSIIRRCWVAGRGAICVGCRWSTCSLGGVLGEVIRWRWDRGGVRSGPAAMVTIHDGISRRPS